MGGLFSRQKNECDKKTGFKFWSNKVDHDKSQTLPIGKSTENNIGVENSSPQPKRGWTDVPLQVSEVTVSNIENDIISNIPVPPPRKHRGKSQKTNVSIEKLEAVHTAPIENTVGTKPNNLIPVEEPIIVPKKEPVHICDGTHHHVTNTVNGKVIHNKQTVPKLQQELKKEIHNELKKEKTQRPKNLSTVSLPNYEELAIKSKNHKHNLLNTNSSRKKPTRHISVVSLPTESKVTLSTATAARLENYIMRCKSFGSLPPKELLEKLQNNLEYSSGDSEESWEGVDEWDMEIIEHGSLRHSPVVPRSRLSAPPNNPSLGTLNENRLPTTIEEVDEVTKKVVPQAPPATQGIITHKKREGRRESIDDFFDSKAENPMTKNVRIKTENYLGRRGSDGFFGYDKKSYPFRSPDANSTLHSDTFFSNALIQSEAENAERSMHAQRRKSAGAALHRIDSREYEEDEDESRSNYVVKTVETEDQLLDSFQQFYKQKSDVEKLKKENISSEKLESTKKVHKNIQNSEAEKSVLENAIVTEKETDTGIVNKLGNIEHSSLLRFLQENAIAKTNLTEKETNLNSDEGKYSFSEVEGPAPPKPDRMENRLQ